MNKPVRCIDIEIHAIELKLFLYEDGNFEVFQNGKRLKHFADKNGFVIYSLRVDKERNVHFFKHEIARRYLLKGIGSHVIYKDGDFKNLKINNLKKCSSKEYREFMIKIADDRSKVETDINVETKVTSEYIGEHMVRLPNGNKLLLPKNISIEDKINSVNKLINDWCEHIESGWENLSIRYFLSDLSNYLVWHRESSMMNKHDKEVLSLDKMKDMDGKKHSRTEPLREEYHN